MSNLFPLYYPVQEVRAMEILKYAKITQKKDQRGQDQRGQIYFLRSKGTDLFSLFFYDIVISQFVL